MARAPGRAGAIFSWYPSPRCMTYLPRRRCGPAVRWSDLKHVRCPLYPGGGGSVWPV